MIPIKHRQNLINNKKTQHLSHKIASRYRLQCSTFCLIVTRRFDVIVLPHHCIWRKNNFWEIIRDFPPRLAKSPGTQRDCLCFIFIFRALNLMNVYKNCVRLERPPGKMGYLYASNGSNVTREGDRFLLFAFCLPYFFLYMYV